MKPSDKSPGVAQFLEELAGRSTSIAAKRCIGKPLGCGEPIGKFRDDMSAREYRISGFCQKCQDKVFGR